MARILVGLPVLHGQPKRYAKRFDMVELRPVDQSLPRGNALRAYRKSVPPHFVFSIVLPRIVGELTRSKAADEALADALAVASAVEARCILLQTPASVRPTDANRRKLAALFEKLPGEAVVRAWEPAGIWEAPEVIATARSIGAIPVIDASQHELPPGPIAYTRLRSLGKTAALSSGVVETVAQRIRGRREVFIVVESERDAPRVRTALKSAAARKSAAMSGPTVVRPAHAIPLIAEDEEQ